MLRRTGRDDNYALIIPLGPVGIGVPAWLPLVFAYFAAVAAALLVGGADEDYFAARLVGAFGPGMIGAVDLIRRLRATDYVWRHPQAGYVTNRASILDRLTFRECGWRLPVLFVPVPLWVAGGALPAVFLRSWGIL